MAHETYSLITTINIVDIDFKIMMDWIPRAQTRCCLCEQFTAPYALFLSLQATSSSYGERRFHAGSRPGWGRGGGHRL